LDHASRRQQELICQWVTPFSISIFSAIVSRSTFKRNGTFTFPMLFEIQGIVIDGSAVKNNTFNKNIKLGSNQLP